MKKSRWIGEAYRDVKYEPRCLFFRGLIPHSVTSELEEENDKPFKLDTSSGKVFHMSYTDGAGAGKEQSHLAKFAQRVGSAAIAYSRKEGELDEFEFIIEGVSGKQTVPRAELQAFNSSEELSPFCRADAAYVVNATTGIYESLWSTAEEPALLRGANNDIWQHAEIAITQQQINPAEKVRSHTTINHKSSKER